MKQTIIIFGLLLVLLMGSAAAQDTAPTLRDLAQRLDFHVGVAVSSWMFDEDERFEATLAREFNLLVTENDAKWCYTQPEEGRFDFTGFDRLMDFAEANAMTVHAHVLIWHQCFPDWLAEKELSRDEALQILRNHIFTVVGRYKGRILYWDVVNEAFDEFGNLRDTHWLRWIGADYIDYAFQFAHEADPDALLFYNDFGAEAINLKSNAIYRLVSGMVQKGIPIHGVGLQTHLGVGDVGVGRPIDPAKLAENMTRLGELGLEVQITEMDVRHAGLPEAEVLQQQAGVFYQVLQTCLETPVCTAFTVWGLADHYSWLKMPDYGDNPDVAPLLFDADFQPKPAYTAVQDALARKAGAEPLLTDDAIVAMLPPRPAILQTELPEPAKSDPAQLAPDPVAGVAYYAPFPVAITLDGDTSDWADIPRSKVENVITMPDDMPSEMQFAVAADADNLYFLAEVRDSALVYGLYDVVAEWYMEDSVEFYINATGNLAPSAYESGIVQLGIAAANIANSGEPLIGGGLSGDVPIQVVVTPTEDGYTVEAAVPLQSDVWTIEPAQGGVLGFQSHLNGASVDSRDTKLIWSKADTEDQSYRDPSLFGRLIFWEAAVG